MNSVITNLYTPNFFLWTIYFHKCQSYIKSTLFFSYLSINMTISYTYLTLINTVFLINMENIQLFTDDVTKKNPSIFNQNDSCSWEDVVYNNNSNTNSIAPEHKGSSPHSQEPAHNPYPEPGESTSPPPPPINLPKVHFEPILPSMPWTFKSYFSFRLSHRNPVHVSPLSCVRHALLTSFSLIWSA
jgi:hypothetical protein